MTHFHHHAEGLIPPDTFRGQTPTPPYALEFIQQLRSQVSTPGKATTAAAPQEILGLTVYRNGEPQPRSENALRWMREQSENRGNTLRLSVLRSYATASSFAPQSPTPSEPQILRMPDDGRLRITIHRLGEPPQTTRPVSPTLTNTGVAASALMTPTISLLAAQAEHVSTPPMPSPLVESNSFNVSPLNVQTSLLSGSPLDESSHSTLTSATVTPPPTPLKSIVKPKNAPPRTPEPGAKRHERRVRFASDQSCST